MNPEHCLKSCTADPLSTAVIGLGNPNRADDGIGIAIAEALALEAPDRVYSERSKSLDSIVMTLCNRLDISSVIFIDAVRMDAVPGTVRLFGPRDIPCIAPVFSSHQAPMTLLCELLEAAGKKRWFLGIEPQSTVLFEPFSNIIEQIKIEICVAFMAWHHWVD